jgi:Uri superfamily endonuclease
MSPHSQRRIAASLVPSAIEAKAGSYSLLFECSSRADIAVGRLGRLRLKHGVYAYVGSALGSGGVRARVTRHLQPIKRQHWHIDYIRGSMHLTRVIFAYSQRRLEHAWASALLRLPEGEPAMSGFGASDCRCASHLVFFRGWPNRVQFGEALIEASPRSAAIHELLLA